MAWRGDDLGRADDEDVGVRKLGVTRMHQRDRIGAVHGRRNKLLGKHWRRKLHQPEGCGLTLPSPSVHAGEENFSRRRPKM
jgi:hypothetical protein